MISNIPDRRGAAEMLLCGCLRLKLVRNKPSLSAEGGERRLASWKEIGSYLGCDARTAQRWEKREGLPVHRHQHDTGSSVYAFTAELDAWREARQPAPAPAPSAGAGSPEPVQVARPRRGLRWLLPALAAVAIATLILIAPALRTERPEPLIPAPLTSWFGAQTAATFSPDGAQLAFTWEGPEQKHFGIYLITIGSSRPVRLTSETVDACSPAWSPDGRRIAFLRAAAGGGTDVVMVPALGGAERILAHSSQRADPMSEHLSWSADAQWLAAIRLSTAEESSPGVSAIHVSSGAIRRLTQPEGDKGDDVNPAYAPDGRSLAFVRRFDGGNIGLFLLPLARDGGPAGKPVEMRLPGFENSLKGSPCWMPDGKELVFVSNYGGAFRLWRVGRTGGRPMLLAGLGDRLTHPLVSMKGRRLVYTRRIYDTGIWRVRLPQGGITGAPEPEQAITSTRTEDQPHYSPDGKRIAFVSDRSGAQEIWICDRDGGNTAQLTNLRAEIEGSPRWSSDGTMIAFDSHAEGSSAIYVVQAAGGHVRRLSRRDTAGDLLPNWSPDGKWIYFCSTRTGAYELWRMPAAGGIPERVTSGGGFASEFSPDGRYLYYSKGYTNIGESTEILRMAAEGGAATVIAGAACDRCFTPCRSGVLVFQYEPGLRRSELYLYSSSGTQPKLIWTVPRRVFRGLSVSPDERTLLFTEIDQDNRNLMLVENFH